ncbi:hypothetical protein ACX80U_17295 [Arthrobacter sp. TmT3-37]
MASPEVEAHTEQHQDDLRKWSSGNPAAEAGTELLIRAFGGRFATPNYPWIIDGEYTPAIDFEAIEGNLQGLYSEERRFLLLIASVGQGGARIDLSEIIPGLDQGLLSLVLAAMAHLGKSHTHSAFSFEDSTSTTVDLPPLYDWPGSTH